MSIAASAIALAPVGAIQAGRIGGGKPPPKRTMAATSDPIIIPEPR